MYDSIKEAAEKCKNLWQGDPKIPLKILFYYPFHFLSKNSTILKAFRKSFPIEMPSKKKKKKNRTRKAKEEGRRERKRNVKVETALTFLNPKILFSVRARTSDSYILYIEQKEAKSARRMNDVLGQFLFLTARQ